MSAVDVTRPNAGDLFLLSQASASSSSQIEFNDFLEDRFKYYIVYIGIANPGTDGVTMQLRTSSDGGSTYDSGASDYQRANLTATQSANQAGDGATGSSIILSNGNVGSSLSTESISGEIHIYGANTDSAYTTMYYATKSFDGSTVFRLAKGVGMRAEANTVNGLQLYFSSGLISFGYFNLYGVQ